MDLHAQFKATQTAAAYVAHGLDEHATEAFELHMMQCPQCLADVEAWRAIQRHMPTNAAATPRTRAAPAPWRLAAAILIAAIAGAGGWVARAIQVPGFDSGQTIFFNLPPVARAGGECTALPLAPVSRTAILRVPGVAHDEHVVLVDLKQHEIPKGRYRTWRQPDGSYVLTLDAAFLAGNSLGLLARTPQGFDEPLGCVMGTRTGP